MTLRPVFRSTITQAFADTVIDDSRSGEGSVPRPVMDVSGLPEVGEVVGGVYRLIRMLGQGTFGKVYVAERTDVPEHQVALKITLREMYSGRDVERELVMLAAASHPHMVQLKDHGTTPEFVWFTMPVYEGETLGKRLQHGTLSLREAYDIFLPIARGLDALHRAGLRHQDLKPDNIFLAQFAGRIHPIILDLGVAAERTSKFVAGTVLFAAPEQIMNLMGLAEEIALDEKMDTYGLAATLLLSLVGMDRYPGGNAGTNEEMAEAQRQRAESPLHPEALPELEGKPREKLIQAFRRWFELDAGLRSSMTEMAEELDVLLEKEKEEQQAEQRLQARQKTNLLRTRLAVAALMLLALVVLGGAYSKRETLRMANQLEQARALGAESFDNLKTCEAFQQVTRNDLGTCQTNRAKDRANYEHSLTQLAKSGDKSLEECTNQVLSSATKLKTCEDDAEAAAKQCSADREKLQSDHENRMTDLIAQRDDFRKTAEERKDQVDITRLSVASCEAALASCRLGSSSAKENPYGDSPKVPSQPAATSSSPVPTAPADEEPMTWD